MLIKELTRLRNIERKAKAVADRYPQSHNAVEAYVTAKRAVLTCLDCSARRPPQMGTWTTA